MSKQLTAGDICKRKVIAGYRQTTLVAAAQMMREDHVGAVVVAHTPWNWRAPETVAASAGPNR